MLVNPNTRTVDHLQLAVVGPGHSFQQAIPNAGSPPSHEPVVAGGVRTIALRHIRPGTACAETPENTVDDPPIVHPRHAPALVGQQRLNHRPLEIRQIKAATQGKAPSTIGSLESKPKRKLNN